MTRSVRRSRFIALTMSLTTMLVLVFVAAIGFARGDSKAEPAIPRLSRETLGKLRNAFNAGSQGPRVIVFFSSGCASCDTGSAALQAMLEKVHGPLTLFAVWEPIFSTDSPPTPEMLDNLKDPRVHQLWDPDHIMSDEMRASELAHPSSPPQARTRTGSQPTGIMFDTVALFAPGARWEATLPPADYLEVGLQAQLGALRKRLEAVGRTVPVKGHTP
jgi:hypothetical protein